jgi:hypothetical protein
MTLERTRTVLPVLAAKAVKPSLNRFQTLYESLNRFKSLHPAGKQYVKLIVWVSLSLRIGYAIAILVGIPVHIVISAGMTVGGRGGGRLTTCGQVTACGAPPHSAPTSASSPPFVTLTTLALQLRWRKARIPCSSGTGGVGSIPANPDAQNVPSFRRWRFEMKLSPIAASYVIIHPKPPRSASLLPAPSRSTSVQLIGQLALTTCFVHALCSCSSSTGSVD